MKLNPDVLRIGLRVAGVVLMAIAELCLKSKVSADVYAKILALGTGLMTNTIASFGQVNVGDLFKLQAKIDSLPPPPMPGAPPRSPLQDDQEPTHSS